MAMITEYRDGSVIEVGNLSDRELADELTKRAAEVDQIERLQVYRKPASTDEAEFAGGNRHERRRQAAQARRRS